MSYVHPSPPATSTEPSFSFVTLGSARAVCSFAAGRKPLGSAAVGAGVTDGSDCGPGLDAAGGEVELTGAPLGGAPPPHAARRLVLKETVARTANRVCMTLPRKQRTCRIAGP